MNWKQVLAAMSGPIGSIVRYAIATGTTALATKYGIDGETTAAVIAGITAVATAALGAVTSSAPVKKEAVAALPDVQAVQTDSGTIRR